MIFVTRDATPQGMDLNDPTSVAAIEREAVRVFIEAGQDVPGATFKCYKADPTKNALLTLFNGKCAYCELNVAAGQDVDVEHYRPKGNVKDAKAAGVDHPGYWWLAMDYANLVTACVHCNQSRKQLIVDPALSEAEIADMLVNGRTRTSGKHDYFPVVNNHWVTSPDIPLDQEEPLLLNPTVDQPDDHLDWRFHETLVTLVPRNGSDKGQVTIDVLGLNRRHLTEDRMKKLLLMYHLRDNIRLTLQLLDDTDSPQQRSGLERLLEGDIRALAAHCAPDQPFSSMAVTLFNQVRAEVEAIPV